MKILLTLIFCFLGPVISAKNVKRRETFIFVGIQIPKQQLEFATLNENGDKTQNYLLDPNPKRNLTFVLHHKDLSISASLPIIDEDERVSGKSDATDFRFKGKFGEILPRIYYQRYKGFQLQDKLNNSANIGFLSQVETLHYGLGASYFLTDGYISFHSGQRFLEKQKNEKGRKKSFFQSFILSSGYDYLQIKGLPASAISSSFSTFEGNSDFKTVTINGGSSLQYFWGAFVVEGTFLIGPGYTWYQAQTGVRKSRATVNGNVELLLSYHFFKKYFALLNIDTHFITGQIEGADLTNSVSSIHLSFGKSF